MSEPIPATFLYLGLRGVGGFGTAVEHNEALERTEHGKRTGDVSLFTTKGGAKNLRRSLFVGRLYEIPVTDGKSFNFGSAKDLGPWPDAAERQAMAAAHRAAEAVVEAQRRATSTKDADRGMHAELSKLRGAYAKLRTSRDRIAFELLVLEALRKPQ